jgi:hypothetical protein
MIQELAAELTVKRKRLNDWNPGVAAIQTRFVVALLILATVAFTGTTEYRSRVLLAISVYVTVSMAGFSSQTFNDITLAVDQTVRLAVTLQPGTVEQSIEVTAAVRCSTAPLRLLAR